MRKQWFTSSLPCLLLIVTSGCARKTSAPTSLDGRNSHVVSMVQRAQPAPDGAPRDAAPAQMVVFQMDIYRLAVPFGTFSSNEEFWKRMDEDCVDPATRDILSNNGIRVGQAPQIELKFFQKFMDQKPQMQRLSTLASEAKKLELEMTKELPTQRIARFDAHNLLSMRDYDRSSNVINMAFEPTPRKPGFVRVTLCPVVRSHRKRFEFTPLNNENEIQYVEPELLYDLNLRVDIPKDRFFIVMPSPDAEQPSTVGAAFLTKQGHTDRQEEVLLIIPRPVLLSDPTPPTR
jgi:hypothetical protein